MTYESLEKTMASTSTKSLKDMSLNDLILSKDSLSNIVEDNELDVRLEGYATTESVNQAVEAAESKLSDYVPLSDYNILNARAEELELSMQQLSTYAEDKDELCGAIQLLSDALNGLSLVVVNASSYDEGLAKTGTMYFIKNDDTTQITAIQYRPTANAESEDIEQQTENQPDQPESSESEQPAQPAMTASRRRKKSK